MWKKLFSIVSLFALSVSLLPLTASAQGGYFSNFSVSPDSFVPSSGETTRVSYTLNQSADIYVYVYDDDFKTVAKLAEAVAQTPGSKSFTWNGRENNSSSGDVSANGTYTITAYAFIDLDNDGAKNELADSQSAEVIIGASTPPVGDAPTITSLSVSPSSFDPYDNEDTQIRFSVDEDADITVTIRDGSSVVRRFSNFDNDFYSAGTRSLRWDGEDDDGDILPDDTYTVHVRASNRDGTDTKTRNVTIEEDGRSSGDIIRNLRLDPRSTWDPDEEDLEIRFELRDDVDDLEIWAERGRERIKILDRRNQYEGDYLVRWDGDDGDIDEGTWEIIVEADNDEDSETIRVDYDGNRRSGRDPEIEEALVTKTSIDSEEDEFVSLIFKVDMDVRATVYVYRGNSRERTLVRNQRFEGDVWNSVKWDGKESDRDDAREGNWKFVLEVEDVNYSNRDASKSISFKVEEDEASSRAVNITEDYTNPVIFDEDRDSRMTFSYCLDDDADVFLGIYRGENASGSVMAEILDYDDEDEGCHTVNWDVEDDDGDELRDGIYSYKFISRDGSYRDTEIGRFVVGERGTGGGIVPRGDGCDSYRDLYGVSEVSELCKAIDWATSEGIVSGYPDGTFRPYANINRAEVLKMVLESFDQVLILPTSGDRYGFRDVEPWAWYMPYVRTAKLYGMLHGYNNGTEARLSDNINRVEALKFALEASRSFAGFSLPNYSYTYYNDAPAYEWYGDYAGANYQYKLFDDYSYGSSYRLNPGAMAQRGEVVMMLYRMNNQGLLD